jgi:hypothetical protein
LLGFRAIPRFVALQTKGKNMRVLRGLVLVALSALLGLPAAAQAASSALPLADLQIAMWTYGEAAVAAEESLDSGTSVAPTAGSDDGGLLLPVEGGGGVIQPPSE